MAVTGYPYSVRDSAVTSGDNRKTGLTPTVSAGKTLVASPVTVLASTVTFVVIGSGDYLFLYDAEVNGDASFPIDWGSALTNPNDRYGTLILTRDPGRILTSLPTAAPAATGGLPTVGNGAGQVNPTNGKIPATLAPGDVSGNLPGDIQTIKTQAVTANNPVTFPGIIGTSTYAGGAVASVTGNVGGNVAGSVNSVASPISVNAINGQAPPANWSTMAVNSTDGGVTVHTNLDKTGCGLADGAITTSKFGAITAGATGFLERLLLLTHRWFPVAGGSVTAPRVGGGSLIVKGTGGAVLSSQPVTDDGTTQTLGPPQ